MDPITHSLGGGLSSDVLQSSRRRFWIFCFLGEAPDLDVFLSHLGPAAFIYQHRGITHSLLGVVAQALLYTGIFARWDTESSFFKRICLYSIPLFFHVLCDALTSYGIPLLSPFSLINFQADITTSVNLIPVIFMSVGYFLIRLKPQRKKVFVTAMCIGWVAYVAFSYSLKIWAEKFDLHDGPAMAVPTLYNPFEWGLVVTDTSKNEYRCYRVNFFKKDTSSPMKVAMADNDPMIGASKTAPLVQKFFHENRWPVARIEKTDIGAQVEWGSLLFSRRGLIRGKVRVFFGPDGNIFKVERFFGFWNPAPKHAN